MGGCALQKIIADENYSLYVRMYQNPELTGRPPPYSFLSSDVQTSAYAQVTVMSASGLQPITPASSQTTWLTRRKSDPEGQAATSSPSPYVELSVGGLARKTKVSATFGKIPRWIDHPAFPLRSRTLSGKTTAL